MAKKPPKPLLSVKFDFTESLDNFVHHAGMLADAVRMILDMPGVIANPVARKSLQERLDTFERATFEKE
jgi:hypothetical protein